jgi:hypothetical protein
MPKSRYGATSILDNNHYATWSYPTFARGYRVLDLLQGVSTIEYTWQRGDRFDILAAKHWNEDTYGWLIALSNGILSPFEMTPGRKIRIAVNYNDLLSKLPTL